MIEVLCYHCYVLQASEFRIFLSNGYYPPRDDARNCPHGIFNVFGVDVITAYYYDVFFRPITNSSPSS